jgi:hypothetical protein
MDISISTYASIQLLHIHIHIFMQIFLIIVIIEFIERERP